MWENCGKNRISGAARSENRDAEREVPADEKSDRSSALGGSKLFNELSALLEKKRDKSERNREGDEVSVRFAIHRTRSKVNISLSASGYVPDVSLVRRCWFTSDGSPFRARSSAPYLTEEIRDIQMHTTENNRGGGWSSIASEILARLLAYTDSAIIRALFRQTRTETGISNDFLWDSRYPFISSSHSPKPHPISFMLR